MIIIANDIGLVNNGLCIYNLDNNKILETLDVTCKDKEITDKLFNIYNKYYYLFDKYKPSKYCYEEPCIIGRGINSTLIPQALGVIKLVTKQFNCPIISYSPTHIKKIVTGDGKADKKQVSLAVSKYFNIPNKFTSDHVSDSLAVLICYLMEFKQRTIK